MDGDRIRIGEHHYECIVGYGHAPEHIALHCAASGILISGDMVLPRISTNISVFAGEPEADPLKLFLTSLKRFDSLSDSTLVLPSHGKPFVGLAERLQQLHAHHQDHLAVARTACTEKARSAGELLPKLFRRELDTQQLSFALGEALAHLHLLWHEGVVHRVREPDGVYRFRTT